VPAEKALPAFDIDASRAPAGRGAGRADARLHVRGAAHAVTRLWRVDDGAAAELTVNSYRGVLEAGKRPAEALRLAQLSMLRQEQLQ
jgi:hypothetical protein